MKLVFLGTGGSYPTPKRNVPCTALKYKGEVILFDCGEGSQRQLMKSSLSFMQVDKIFITHFHGDHFLGVPGLVQSMNMNDREEPLYIYGPEGTVSLLKDLLSKGYFGAGFPIRIAELEPQARLNFPDYHIVTFRPDHNVPSLAYSFEERDKKGRFDREKALELGVPEGPLFSRIHEGETVEIDGETIRPEQIVGPPRKGKKIVYTGDTRPCQNVIEASIGADVLIHDSTLDSSMSDRAVERGHSSTTGAAKVASKARVERLFLTHISPRYNDGKKLEEEAGEIFEDSVVPDDFFEYEL
ncbi:MAG: ribonuclease Z [Candidatus Thermoplasmatota archaeon]